MSFINQIMHFVGISGIGWIIDFFIFNILNFILKNVIVCNIFSSLFATSFVFILSTRKTFVQNENGIDLKLKFILYIVYQFFLIFVVSAFLSFVNSFLLDVIFKSHFSRISSVVAKILVTPVTMITNFVAMKLLIEKI